MVSVLEDLVVLLHPQSANPAKIKVNNIEFFIGGLSCPKTDRVDTDRFTTHLDSLPYKKNNPAAIFDGPGFFFSSRWCAEFPSCLRATTSRLGARHHICSGPETSGCIPYSSWGNSDAHVEDLPIADGRPPAVGVGMRGIRKCHGRDIHYERRQMLS